MDYTQRQAKIKRCIEANGLTGTAAEVATALNTQAVTGHKRVTIAELQNMITARGKGLTVAGFLASPPTGAEALAKFLDMFLGGKQEDFNPLDASSEALYGALQSIGILDADDVTAIKALAETRQSPAEAAGLGTVSEAEISTVMAMDI